MEGPGRVKYLSARIESQDGKLLAFNSGEQSTRKMKTLLTANAIALLPFATGKISPGTEVDVKMMSANELMKVEETMKVSTRNAFPGTITEENRK